MPPLRGGVTRRHDQRSSSRASPAVHATQRRQTRRKGAPDAQRRAVGANVPVRQRPQRGPAAPRALRLPQSPAPNVHATQSATSERNVGSRDRARRCRSTACKGLVLAGAHLGTTSSWPTKGDLDAERASLAIWRNIAGVRRCFAASRWVPRQCHGRPTRHGILALVAVSPGVPNVVGADPTRALRDGTGRRDAIEPGPGRDPGAQWQRMGSCSWESIFGSSGFSVGLDWQLEGRRLA